MRACGFCHLVNGQGRPENAPLAGVPAADIVQQMADFKNGARKIAEPEMELPNAMIQDAKAAHDEEIRTPTNDGTEALGQRIVEIPEDVRWRLRRRSIP